MPLDCVRLLVSITGTLPLPGLTVIPCHCQRLRRIPVLVLMVPTLLTTYVLRVTSGTIVQEGFGLFVHQVPIQRHQVLVVVVIVYVT